MQGWGPDSVTQVPLHGEEETPEVCFRALSDEDAGQRRCPAARKRGSPETSLDSTLTLNFQPPEM